MNKARVLRLSSSADANNASAVQAAVDALSHRQVVALPTDTLYGFAVDARSDDALHALYLLKNRPRSNPIALCCHSAAAVQPLIEPGCVPTALLHDLLPGPYTLILPVLHSPASPLAHDIQALHSVGFRVPNATFVRSVCGQLGHPIALTSANASGEPSSVEVQQFGHLHHHVGLVVDGGRVGLASDPENAGSTVLDISYHNTGSKSTFRVLRRGAGFEHALQALEDYGFHLLDGSITS